MGPNRLRAGEWPGRQPTARWRRTCRPGRARLIRISTSPSRQGRDGSVAGLEIADVGAMSPSWRSSRAPPPDCSPTTTSPRRAGSSSPVPPPPAGLREHLGRPFAAPSAPPAASWSPAAASRPSRPRRLDAAERRKEPSCQDYQGRRPHRRHRRTATAVSNRVSKRQGERWAQQEAPSSRPNAPTPEAAPAARQREFSDRSVQGAGRAEKPGASSPRRSSRRRRQAARVVRPATPEPLCARLLGSCSSTVSSAIG